MGGDRRTAALVIDMQEDFFAHGRLVERRPKLSRRVNEMLAICRQAEVPVVWVRQEWAPDMSDAMLDARKKGARITIAGTKGAALLAELDRATVDGISRAGEFSVGLRELIGKRLDGLRKESEG